GYSDGTGIRKALAAHFPACSLDRLPGIGQGRTFAATMMSDPAGAGSHRETGTRESRMNGRHLSARAKTIPASKFAAALLGCTVLAGIPTAALAQDDAAPAEPAPAPAEQAPAPAEQSNIIRTIAVAGAQRLEPATIVSYIQLRPGQPYTAAAADQALKDLAATELFTDDTRIDFNNGNVVITVQENPVINRIVLEGNRRLKDDKILPEIKLAPRQIFTRSKVRADVARIIELYKRQGRF